MRRRLIADLGRQRRTHRQTLLDQARTPGLIGGNPVDTLGRKVGRGGREQFNGLQEVIGHHRQHHDQFKVGGLPPEGNRHIVADDLRAHHRHGFGNDRVHLARHDGGARLGLRQIDLPQPTAGARAQPANVVGDLHEAHGEGLQRSARLDQRILRGLRFKVVRGFGKEQPVSLEMRASTLAGELRMAIEPRADRRAAERHFAERLLRPRDPLNAQFNLPRIAAELLPQSHRGGILQMGPPDLDDLVESLALRPSVLCKQVSAGRSCCCSISPAAM